LAVQDWTWASAIRRIESLAAEDKFHRTNPFLTSCVILSGSCCSEESRRTPCVRRLSVRATREILRCAQDDRERRELMLYSSTNSRQGNFDAGF
jgi:hypothetical protein